MRLKGYLGDAVIDCDEESGGGHDHSNRLPSNGSLGMGGIGQWCCPQLHISQMQTQSSVAIEASDITDAGPDLVPPTRAAMPRSKLADISEM